MNGHGFINGEHIQIADESLSFTCGLDNNATTHKYPRATDPVSKKWLAISNVATDTFDVQVLDTIPSTNVFAHSCTQIAANAIKRAVVSSGGDYAHTFVSAVSNCVQYKPQETHTFVSANPGAVKRVLRQHTYVTAATDGVVVLNYQSNEDCTDIQTSCENLINILTDTLTSANLPTPVDHLGTLVRRTLLMHSLVVKLVHIRKFHSQFHITMLQMISSILIRLMQIRSTDTVMLLI